MECLTITGEASGIGAPDDRAEELLLDAISGNRSMFGRLIEVASLRDPDTGLFTHDLSKRLGAHAVDSVLQRLHRDVFESWLQLSIRQQVADWMGNASAEEREAWIRQGQNIGVMVMPQNFKPLERDLFLADLALVTMIVRDQEKGLAG